MVDVIFAVNQKKMIAPIYPANERNVIFVQVQVL